MSYAGFMLIAYLLGSIPFGFILAKIAGKGDIRNVSSGGTGATNVARVLGVGGFVATWVLDMAKTIAAVVIGRHFAGAGFGALCGFFACVGHCFPVWLKWHGGKGISCVFGAMLAVNPLLFIIVGIEWIIVAVTTRYSSLGALVAFVVMPILAFAISVDIGLAFSAMSLLCIFQHRANIKRLVTGTESKIQMNVGKLVGALVLIGLILSGLIMLIYYV